MTTDAGTRAVELTQELVRVPSVNPGGTEGEVTRLVGALLAEAGFDVTTHELASDRPSLIATFLPEGSSGRAIGLAGHVDTVPLGAAPWEVEPFSGAIRDGKLYGRGSSDMKAGIATAVVAATEVVRTRGAQDGVVVVICAGEETGCEGAADLESAGLLPTVAKLVITEPTGNDVLVAHKGALWLRVTTTGTTAHGSMPHLGDNAISRLLAAIEDIESAELAGRHPLLGTSTRTLSQIHAGMNVNSVPDRAEATFDIRTTPDVDHRMLLSALTEAAGGDVAVEPITDLPSLDTSVSDPWVVGVRRTVETITGRAQPGGGVSYFTDASVLKRAMGSPPTVVCGPGIAQQAHRTDEYCYVADVHESVNILRSVIETGRNRDEGSSAVAGTTHAPGSSQRHEAGNEGER